MERDLGNQARRKIGTDFWKKKKKPKTNVEIGVLSLCTTNMEKCGSF